MTFEKISVLVPTRGRVPHLRTLLQSFDSSCAELVFRVDDDDLETQSFLAQYPWTVMIGPRCHGYASIPVFFNEAVQAALGDVVMLGNDDMRFVTPHWAESLLHEANQYRDGIFNLGVSTLNETHFPFSVVSKRVTNALGFVCDPRLFWVDIFLRDIMAHFGRCVMVPSVRVEHDWAGYPYDVLHRDPAYWTMTHPLAVKNAIAVLQDLFVEAEG